MCFPKAPKPPEPKKAPPPPTERDATIANTRTKAEKAALAKNSGFESTVLTGPLGIPGGAPAMAPKLGA